MKKLILILFAIICLSNNCVQAQSHRGSHFYWNADWVFSEPTSSKKGFISEIILHTWYSVSNMIENWDYFVDSETDYYESVYGGQFALFDYFPASYMSVKNNGYEVFENRKFKFKEWFGNSYVYANFGWMWSYTALCPYVSVKFRWQNFNVKFLEYEEPFRNRIRTFIPGIGVRMPFAQLKREWGWSPVVEIATECNIITNYKQGIYGTDKNQLNNKTFTHSYGVGVEFFRLAVVATLFMNSNELYNTEYSPDGGYYYPFANIKTSDMSFKVNCSYFF